MGKRIEISMKEIKQGKILEQLIRKEISKAAAAAILGLSTRQVSRKLRLQKPIISINKRSTDPIIAQKRDYGF